ncbi:hypothetical protein [Streptococcus ictaluri]|uniref:Uncharacterized protein n=1 Tax=Streptococcus ictaluri 707-05 TaxID=764299 RepID=G5K139_9STRE|nr:hypothetical protein [Streptococcus ictaluri]EHI70413.1 hypothetical protein STRIC_0315 [Streptococcus ictaluri 707-05]
MFKNTAFYFSVAFVTQSGISMIKAQLSFKTDSELLSQAKQVLTENKAVITKKLNLFLKNLVMRCEIPLLT